MSSPERTAAFNRNAGLEQLLDTLNAELAPAETAAIEPWRTRLSPHPIVLVMGPMRSGTTLLMQCLARSGLVAYPTNLLARFWRAPLIGARIQLMLTDPRFDFRGELAEFARPPDFESTNGKTTGATAPNEFWYFWRRLLADPSREAWVDDAELERELDHATANAELAALSALFDRPFAAKAMLFNYHIPLLARLLPGACFVQVRRDRIANTASVLEARMRQFGSETPWWSFRIPEFERLQAREPLDQAAGQVCAIERAVSRGMNALPAERGMVLDYEALCAQPEAMLRTMFERFGIGVPEGWGFAGPANFAPGRAVQEPLKSRIHAAITRSDEEFGCAS